MTLQEDGRAFGREQARHVRDRAATDPLPPERYVAEFLTSIAARVVELQRDGLTDEDVIRWVEAAGAGFTGGLAEEVHRRKAEVDFIAAAPAGQA